MGGRHRTLPGAAALKSQHRPQSVGFPPTLHVCVRVRRASVPCCQVPGRWRGLCLGTFLISWGREESGTAKPQLQTLLLGSSRLAEAGPVVRPDVNGLGIITQPSTGAFPEASHTERPRVLEDSWVFGCFMDLCERLK